MYSDINRLQANIDVEKINNCFTSKGYQEFRLRLANLEDSIRILCDLQKENIEGNIMKLAQQMEEPLSKVSVLIDNSWINNPEEIRKVFGDVFSKMKQLYDCIELKSISDSMLNLTRIFENYSLVYFANSESIEENLNDGNANIKIVDEIFNPNETKGISKKETAIITLSPINDKVLKYLSENPQAFYRLDDRGFEAVMAEIYNKLGYEVELTKATRDGGKDIMIRRPEILGDFIYYVECKKYAAKRHIGVGIIRNLVGTISTDRVNGGILATTSFFTKDAKDYILENDLGFQIKMHDFEVIRNFLDRVV